MNDKEVLKLIKERRSIRKFSNRPISDIDLIELIDAGIHAPTGSNVQAYRVMIIKNKEDIYQKEEDELNGIIYLREKRHIYKILEYKEKTSSPIVIIIGCWHLREGSSLRKKLKNYKLIPESIKISSSDETIL